MWPARVEEFHDYSHGSAIGGMFISMGAADGVHIIKIMRNKSTEGSLRIREAFYGTFNLC